MPTVTTSAELFDATTATRHSAAPFPDAARDVMVGPSSCGGALAIGGFDGRAGAVFLADGSLLVRDGASIETVASAERLFVN